MTLGGATGRRTNEKYIHYVNASLPETGHQVFGFQVTMEITNSFSFVQVNCYWCICVLSLMVLLSHKMYQEYV